MKDSVLSQRFKVMSEAYVTLNFLLKFSFSVVMTLIVKRVLRGLPTVGSGYNI